MIAHQRLTGSGRTLCNTNYTLNSKDPRIKNPGVFCFPQGKMIDKQIKETEWTKQHELTKEQFKQLIVNKLARAKQYHQVEKKREIAQG